MVRGATPAAPRVVCSRAAASMRASTISTDCASCWMAMAECLRSSVCTDGGDGILCPGRPAVMIGKRVGHYEILDRIGTGGASEVYRARDTRLGRDVALKVLPSEMAADSGRLWRFEREAQVAGSPQASEHRHDPLGRGVRRSAGFLTMELVEGRSLTRRIPATGLELGPFLADRGPARRRPLRRARARRHASRPQARQHHADGAGPGEDPRLRPGATGPRGGARQGSSRERIAASRKPRRWTGSCSAPSPTCPRSNCSRSRPTRARTCSRSGSSCTRCSTGDAALPGRDGRPT